MSDDRVEGFKKQLSRMVKDEDGRKLLSESFGLNLSNEDRSQLPTVAILIPSYGNPKPAAQSAWEAMIREASKVANVYRPIIYGHSILHWVRNEMIAKLYRESVPFTHVLFIDDDIEPAPDSLVRMLSHGKDIVGGLCTRRADPPMPTLRSFDEPSGDFVQLYQWKQGGLLQVDALGTGMMLISRQALDDIAKLYLNCGYEDYAMQWAAAHAIKGGKIEAETISLQYIAAGRAKQIDIASDERWRKNGCWFQTLPAVNGCGEYGEDISFCLKAKLCGIPVYCDTEVTPLHHGDYGYGIADFFAHKRTVIEEAKRNGTYREAPQPQEIARDYRRLTVVIPTYNQLQFTKECVKSLLENTASDVDLVIVDDGSTDGTWKWVAGLYESGGVTPVQNHGNKGVNYSWNRGISMAIGNYVAVCNNDIIFAPGWDKGLLDALDAGAAIASPLHTLGPSKPADWPQGHGRQPNPITGIPFLGCCFAFKRSLWDEIGPIPETLRTYYGDNWIVDRVKQLGKAFRYAPESYIHHFFMQTTAKDEGWKEQLRKDEVAYQRLEVAAC